MIEHRWAWQSRAQGLERVWTKRRRAHSIQLAVRFKIHATDIFSLRGLYLATKSVVNIYDVESVRRFERVTANKS